MHELFHVTFIIVNIVVLRYHQPYDDQHTQLGRKDTSPIFCLDCGPYYHEGYYGNLQSPWFPNNYPNGMDCSYYIVQSSGNNIHLNFAFFELEDSYNCTNDYVEVSILGGQLLLHQ